MTFEATILEIVESVPRYKEEAKNEQQTIEYLIQPFIDALGYDRRNSSEVAAQHTVMDHRRNRRVDYAILRDGKPTMIFECKPASNDQLTDNRGQLRAYFDGGKPDIGILTNGIKYQFFSNLDNGNTMDSAPFLEIDLEKVSPDDEDDDAIAALKLFRKEQYNPDTLRPMTMRMKRKSGVRQVLEQQFGAQPSDELVRWLAEQIGVRNLRAGHSLDEFAELTKEVLAEFIKDEIHAATAKESASSYEVEGHYIIKNILWGVVPAERVQMNDHKTYCSIQLDDGIRSRKRVCLLKFNDLSKLAISLFDNVPSGQGEVVAIDQVGDINNHAERIRERARQILSSEK